MPNLHPLHLRILEALTPHAESCCCPGRDDCACCGADGMQDAANIVQAVLEQHKPIGLYHHDGPGGTSTVCADCRYFAPTWPCPTVRLIAKQLGVEADS